ncbi:C40 family peptidase [Mucilaginibacter litoreus]|uniref:C40 family peptidase n=1 Tax=Mucilaginibacter litoreus TaxID=1048221 RepID=A0ABW3AN46_9SPHI
MRYKYLLLFVLGLCASCGEPRRPDYVITQTGDTVIGGKRDTLPSAIPDSAGYFTKVPIGNLCPEQLVTFANTLKGTPYKYASTDPAEGFDCSGFITYVFNHFGIKVPRRSFDFVHVDHEVKISNAKPGDLILFTGTDSTDREVGHMGIVVSKPGDTVSFIHSTSGKGKGVVITPFNSYYAGRYVKTIRIFPQNDR